MGSRWVEQGSLGQGDLTSTTLEGRSASKLSFYGMAVQLGGAWWVQDEPCCGGKCATSNMRSVEAALSNLSYTAPAEFEGVALMKVLIRAMASDWSCSYPSQLKLALLRPPKLHEEMETMSEKRDC